MTKTKAKKHTNIRGTATSTKAKKASFYDVRELSEAQLRCLSRGCRIDGQAEEVIADPEYTIQAMIEGKVEKLSYISTIINYYMKKDQQIRDATIPEITKYLKPEYRYKEKVVNPSDLIKMSKWHEKLKTLPDQEKYHIVTWDEFRKKRKKDLNEYNHSQSLEVFVPSTLRIFPLMEPSDYTERYLFKILLDDCKDMVDFLKNVKKLSPVFLLILFLRIEEIESRFNYLSGYYKVEYQGDEKIKEYLRQVGKKGGEKPKKIQPILLGITQYLMEDPSRVTMSNEQIVNSFKRDVNIDKPIIVIWEDNRCDIYCCDRADSDNGFVMAEPWDTKNRDYAIELSTLRNHYIPEAKRIIKKEQNN
jgi:hypothetical protein